MIISYLQILLLLMLIASSLCKTLRLKPISGDSFSNKLHLVCFPQEFPKINKWIRFLPGISILLSRSTPQVANWQRERLSAKPFGRRGLTHLFVCFNKRYTRAERISVPRFFLIGQCQNFANVGENRRRCENARIYRRYLCFWNAIRAVLIKSRRGADDSYREFFAIFAFLCSLEVNSARVAPFSGDQRRGILITFVCSTLGLKLWNYSSIISFYNLPKGFVIYSTMSRFENKLSDAKLHNFQSQFVVLDEAKLWITLIFA